MKDRLRTATGGERQRFLDKLGMTNWDAQRAAETAKRLQPRARKGPKGIRAKDSGQGFGAGSRGAAVQRPAEPASASSVFRLRRDKAATYDLAAQEVAKKLAKERNCQKKRLQISIKKIDFQKSIIFIDNWLDEPAKTMSVKGAKRKS